MKTGYSKKCVSTPVSGPPVISQEYHFAMMAKLGLKRPPDIHMFDNEEFDNNPLMHFRSGDAMSRRVCDRTTFLASRQKAKVLKTKLPKPSNDPKIPITGEIFLTGLRQCAETIPTAPMQRSWVRDIQGRMPKTLRIKYADILEKLINEAKSLFNRDLHAHGLCRTLKPLVGEHCATFEIPHFKYDGRSQTYHLYLKRRARFTKIFFLHRRFMRGILSKSVQLFPDVLNDYSVYRLQGLFDANRLKQVMAMDLKKGEATIINDWYPAITKGLKSEWKSRDKFIQNCRTKYLACVKGYICQQITELMRRTIEHFLVVVADPMSIPMIELHMFFETLVETDPTMYEVFGIYHSVLDAIATSAQRLPTLEAVLELETQDDYLNVTLARWYVREAHNRLQVILNKTFTPLLKYLKCISQHFSSLYRVKYNREMEKYLSVQHTFDEGCNRIAVYKSYIIELHEMVVNEYFDIAKLNQEDFLVSMAKYAQEMMDRILLEMVESHRQNNLSICSDFEALAAKALTQPTSTEELMASGEYFIWARTAYMEEMEERISNSLSLMAKLIEIATLTNEHVQLNTTTINWLSDIIPIFEINASNYEAAKFEYEERLRTAIETLLNGLQSMLSYVDYFNRMNDLRNIRDYIEYIRQYVLRVFIFEEQKEWINKEEALFKFGITEYPLLETIKNFIFPFYNLIYLCYKWTRNFFVWMDGQFEYLDGAIVEETVDVIYKEILKVQKAYKNKIRQDDIDGSPMIFSGNVDDIDVRKLPAPLQLCITTVNHIKTFREYIPVVSILCNPALEQRHWDEMSKIASYDMTPDAGTTLRKIINLNLGTYLDQFEIISIGACKELQLYTNLHAMMAEWKDIRFSTSLYKDTEISILSGLDDIQAVLDDHIVKTLSMRGSAFVRPFENSVRAWYAKIMRINDTIEEWGKVQSQWLYLLPIFSSKDIVAQMPEEGILFAEVDGTYRQYMSVVAKDPRVVVTAPLPGLLEALQKCSELLETINDGVNAYLETKRLYFPRFFFLSNDEMLEILSETKNPLRVQPHLKKCFEGINRLLFDYDLNIKAMISGQNEEIKLVDTISTKNARGSVEKWLLEVEEQMAKSVHKKIQSSYEDYIKKRRDAWVLGWPGQVVLCVSQIYWSKDVHDCMEIHKIEELHNYHQVLVKQIHDIVARVRSPLITNLDRITIKALIVIDVHAKDVVEDLVRKKIVYDSDFQWLSQLRYYWVNSVQVKIINAVVKYANEYLGNTDRLVITPLTDRCYRTLIGAYHLHLNGAPEGPAGTGKTETTKDLAKAIAVQCVVFNCSDGLDYKAMGKFFKGLATAGAWACFDEFNRIELEVLSVVAQQILCIIQAVRAHVDTFMFEGTELKLNPSCYVCITMNPGYAGRSELPDNLKVLFRTVAMMVPDYAMIGEISLYSFGFVDARSLSIKIVTVYRLCSEQLSSQFHYDYGMRAVKTVLSACGNNKQKFPDENEDILLLRSITDVNLPKFLSFDVPLFQGIISDLFPGIDLPKPDYDVFLQGMMEICKEMNLQPKECVITKVIQTYEMMIVRHGFMLVGDPYAGKTSVLKILAALMTKLHLEGKDYQETRYVFLNPKAITMGQLYGAFDPVSYEWTDGIGATIFRHFATDSTLDRKWMIFDGPVDAVWIENMNTVLDDNKKLCLTSGEVITMSESMSMIFEVMDLAQASPATVSRCGMIYMEPATLGWEPLVESWIAVANAEWRKGNEKLLYDMFVWCVQPTLIFVRKFCHQLVTGGELNLVNSTIRIFEMLLNDAYDENKEEDNSKYVISWIEACLVSAVVWGIAGILDIDSRAKFDEFYKGIWRGTDPNNPVPEILQDIDISIPNEGLLIDYVYVFKLKGCWKHWPELVKAIKTDDDNNDAVIPTIDTLRYCNQLNLHIRHRVPMLLVGPTGTGKTFYVQNYLMNNLDDSYEPAFVTFTSQTTANQTQELILSKLQKHKKGIYGPPKGKISILFVDDLNMPAKEIYGAQPPIELLRQYFDHRHWYDLTTTLKLFVEDILYLAAMGLPGGSRQVIYQRLLRHYCIYSINEFSEGSLQRIFSLVLLNGFKKNGFAADVMSTVMDIIRATLEIYKYSISELRPTPLKSHYVFNLRDIARTVQGCALLRKESAEDKHTFAKLWIHEILRVFGDRLIERSDEDWLLTKIVKCTADFFKEKIANLLEEYADEHNAITTEGLKSLMFGTFMDTESADDERKYEEVPNLDVFKKIGMNAMEEYNSTHKTKLNIVLFNYALEHLSKVCRIVAMPGGSALMVGIGGSGRQSLIRLTSAIMSVGLFQPEISKNYNLQSWRDDIKKILRDSGGVGKDLLFLFTEGQIKEEVFLQDIDCLLNSGEVPNLYAIDEKQEILELVRLAAQGGNRNLDVSPLQVFSFFSNRVKSKLHMALCFSPIGSAFRNRVRMYPSLVNCCTINWMEDWPEDSLAMVANRYMKDVHLPADVKQSAVTACKYFHVFARHMSDTFFTETGRKTYITSASYLDLIKAFATLTNDKQKETMEAKMRYIIGLEKLYYAAEAVSRMQKELTDLKPKLVLIAEETRRMAELIEIESKEAQLATEQVKKDEKVANVQAAAAQELKMECEADLALAIPILNEALAALDTLKPADVTLVKSMKNPPAAVKLVMAAVCVMKDIKPDKIPDPSTGRMVQDYWGPSKKLLGDMYFLQHLKDFDKDNIQPAIIAKIRKEYIPHKDFKPQIVAKASSAAKGLCKWVIAMDLYEKVAKIVGPKKAKLAAAEAEFSTTMAILNEQRALVERLDKRVADLNEELTKANAEKLKVETGVELCISKLYRAEKLIGGLGGEKTRWNAAADRLQTVFDCLAGDILVSCGVIAYLAPFTMSYRQQCTEDWRNYCIRMEIPCSKTYSFEAILGSEIKMENWYIAGLPRDSFSTDNAIIQDTSYRWSLLVDPQGQANKWIKITEKLNDLKVVKFSDNDYMKALEFCIEFGQPALIENIGEDLEAPLDPLLLKSTFIQGGKEFISLGDNVIEYNPNFRLYLTSKLRNPHYLPEVFNKVTLINFALTITGLEDQLLGIVVAKERPDLQEKRQQLIVQNAANKTALKEVEDQILKTLSETKGDILEDETAINILDSSKLLSDDILKKQEIAKETGIKIDAFRMSYRPIAIHSSNLYYCVTDLPNVDPMYQFSLPWFIGLYIMSIETSNKSKDIERRLRFLRESFTMNLYNNVCRSLFEKDKLLFSLILTTKIMLARKELDQLEFTFFLTGGIQVDNPFPNPSNDWLSDKSWDEICRLSNDLRCFKGFRADFCEKLGNWKKFYDETDPQDSKFPSPWDEKISQFQKLIIIRALRPDKITATVIQYIEQEMGPKFVLPPGFDIVMSHRESNCLAPLVFILSPGADPMDALIKFAEQQGHLDKFSYISLGQGQGPIAQDMISEAQKIGGWVCLQNCHLAYTWMPTLEKIWENFDLSNTHNEFRLWLTSYPSDAFPTSILQYGVKMTNEPPTGLQANLLRSYLSEPVKDEAFFEGCPGKHKEFTKLLYGICFFHAVVQERRNFGPVGWNIPYGFNESDFQISVRQLQMFINEFEEIQYVAIAYLTGECNYGGRVTDGWDRRAIVTILEDFVNSDVVFNPRYMFSTAGPEYGLPKRCDYKEFLKHVEAIPSIPPPEVFGLHMNAGISRDMQVSALLVNSMLLVQGQGAGASASKETEILIAFVQEILSKLPKPFDLEEVGNKYPVMYNESMNTVLLQEMQRFNHLLIEIIVSLSNVSKASQGDIVMTAALEQLGQSVVLGRIPASWNKVSYPSLKSLAAFIADLIERLEVLQLWYTNGKPVNFWLSGFFFTQAFLTGAMQNYARKYVIPIDTLTFDFEILKKDRFPSSPADGVYVYGLFTDGARWDRKVGQLEEQYPKVLNDTMPLMWLKPIIITLLDKRGRYESPVYKTSERKGILSTTGHSTNYVLPVLLNTNRKPAHWIKRSVALLCQLD